jgi:hypothetical protein
LYQKDKRNDENFIFLVCGKPFPRNHAQGLTDKSDIALCKPRK